jgi:pantoate--beta-alanine ligase
MKVVRTTAALRAALGRIRVGNKKVGFVPTMGALHAGHLSLIRRARRDNDIVVVSIFVNPLQFGRGEDLKRYPRPLSRDLAFCRKAGVDIVFNPSAQALYPGGFATYVRVDGLSDLLCGARRPGHFRGVATVVAKLFNLVQPNAAYFGQKDAQQAIIIRKMARELDLPLQVKVLPTVRAPDGLALSSRNAYLNPAQRKEAVVLWQSLALAGKLFKAGLRDCGKLESCIRALVGRKKQARLEYVAIVDGENLRPLKRAGRGSLIALAVRFGHTRLIDNIVL